MVSISSFSGIPPCDVGLFIEILRNFSGFINLWILIEFRFKLCILVRERAEEELKTKELSQGAIEDKLR